MIASAADFSLECAFTPGEELIVFVGGMGTMVQLSITFDMTTAPQVIGCAHGDFLSPAFHQRWGAHHFDKVVKLGLVDSQFE